MSKAELKRRYLVCLIAIVIGALGVCLMTRAMIGVNSVGCATYVLAYYFPLSMGTFTIILYALMLIVQVCLQSKEERKSQRVFTLMQIPTFVLFGLFLDLFLFLTRSFQPETIGYLASIITFLISVVLTSFCFSVQMCGQVAKMPSDAFVITLAGVLKKRSASLSFTLILS